MGKHYRIGRKPAGYNKRTKEQREWDIAFCANLFLRGYTYKEITQRLNEELEKRGADYTISLTMVYYDLQQSLIEWKRERMDDIDDYVTQELRKLDKIEVELWEAWEKSKSGKMREKTRRAPGRPRKEEGNRSEYEEETIESSAGNPRFLDLLLNVQQRRAKMLGFDAPVKIDIPGARATSDDDTPKYDVKAIPPELLFEVADKLQSAEYMRVMEERGAI